MIPYIYLVRLAIKGAVITAFAFFINLIFAGGYLSLIELTIGSNNPLMLLVIPIMLIGVGFSAELSGRIFKV